jgi:cytochrome d ubiquinol oxidase subunit II
MLTLIIIILCASFLLYALLGGADFGAGIIETFVGKKGEETVSRAMAPVWEANHVWLILAVVILFTAFPSIYSSLSLVLHIPLMIVLIGIICRGTAFTFRKYDVMQGNAHKYYSVLFKLSSFITPLFLGIILGAMILGRITFSDRAGFAEKFISPWFNTFCIAMGIFSASLFSYIAAIFLVGEAQNETEKKKYSLLSKQSMVITVLMGIAIFILAETENLHLAGAMLQSEAGMIMVLFATLACSVIWKLLNRKTDNTRFLRIAVAIQVSAIIIGWFCIQFPIIIRVSSGEHLTLSNTHSPSATLKYLLIALIAGLLLIIPAFIYLFKVFKAKHN